MANLFQADFCWATGIENTFIPQIRPGFRALDEYTLTQHYQQWKSDIDLVAETGVQALRWGIPWYRVQPRPGQWEWAWVDQVLDYMVNVKGIIPILDLMHYGTPLWLDNSFINHGYPEAVARYAAAVAARYKSLVRYYTPYNEPVLSAEWSGFRGEWPPYLNGEDGYIKVLLGITRGIIRTVEALKAEQSNMQTIQVEAIRHFWTQPPEWQPLVARLNEQQYLSLDLSLGRINEDHPLYAFLLNLGVSEGELAWFRDHAINFDFLGVNFYPWSYGELAVRKHGGLYRLPRQTHGAALGEVSARVHARYQLPIMITETSAKGNLARRAQWMDETVSAIYQLRRQGVAVVGYTWFPLFSMVDWIYRRGRRPLENYLIHLGLYDSAFDPEGVLRRHVTPLVERYQKQINNPAPPIMAKRPEG